MFREVPTCDPTIFGPNRPLIGAHLNERDAIATETRHPGMGVHWIEFDITGLMREQVTAAVRPPG